jgi:hypothetical protein
MKKFTPILVLTGFVVVVVLLFLSLAKTQKMVVIKEGNTKRVALPIELHKYQDSFCGMVIDDTTYASEVVAPDGKTWFFHDHGDFVEWLKDKPFAKDAVIWVHAIDTNRWIDGKKAFYTQNEITPMEYGFGAYEHQRKGMIDFEAMRLYVLRGETMKNPHYKQQLLGKKYGNN